MDQKQLLQQFMISLMAGATGGMLIWGVTSQGGLSLAEIFAFFWLLFFIYGLLYIFFVDSRYKPKTSKCKAILFFVWILILIVLIVFVVESMKHP